MQDDFISQTTLLNEHGQDLVDVAELVCELLVETRQHGKLVLVLSSVLRYFDADLTAILEELNIFQVNVIFELVEFVTLRPNHGFEIL